MTLPTKTPLIRPADYELSRVQGQVAQTLDSVLQFLNNTFTQSGNALPVLTSQSRTFLGNAVIALPAGATAPTNIMSAYITVPFAGSLAAVTIQAFTTPVTGGNATIQPTIQGQLAATPTIINTGAFLASSVYAPNKYTFAANNYLGLQYSAATGFAPAQSFFCTFWGYV